MWYSNYSADWHRLRDERDIEIVLQERKRLHLQDARNKALHTEQIKEVYRNSSKIADLVYIQGYGEFLLDKNDNLIKVQKEQDNEL